VKELDPALPPSIATRVGSERGSYIDHEELDPYFRRSTELTGPPTVSSTHISRSWIPNALSKSELDPEIERASHDS